MNRFFTLLFAASCLTAVGQTDYVPDSVLIDEGWSLVLEIEGQQYWLFDEDRQWEDARAMCEAQGAYLYWPNSIEEHQTVWESVPTGFDEIHFWTAIHQDFSLVNCSSPNGGWAGPNGEPQTFFMWANSEPSNGNGKESVVQFEWDSQGALWNDAPGQACDDGNNSAARFSRVILERTIAFGCTDLSACNFDEWSSIDDGSCDYSCCPGPGCCGMGTTWNWQTSECDVANPSDSNFDGCVQLNDLLDLLSAYGDCGAEESAWQCGDPLEYQGYDYETVQIGEQCWFAENLRVENYRNGDSIQADLSDSEWAGTAEGAVSVYDEDMVKLSTYGRLYNRYAVDDTRALCPSNWHVSTDDEWVALELEMTNQGYAGTEGHVLKATEGWTDSGNGSDTFGFSARPAGARNFQDGTFYNEGIGGDWWTSSTYHRFLLYNFDTLGQGLTSLNFGFSIRCIKDVEQ